MARRIESVTMGAPEFKSLEVGPFRVTDAYFPSGSQLEPHVHARPVVATILDGSFDDIFPVRTFECVRSSILVEPAEDKHANRFGRGGARVLIVEPDPTQEELLRPCRRLLSEAQTFVDPGVAALAARLSWEVNHQDDLTPLAVEGLVLELFAHAARHTHHSRTDVSKPRWLRRATDYVHEQFRKPVRLDDIAAVADVHPVHLARVFRNYHGTSIGSYVRRLRLQWAAEQMYTKDASLSQIAVRAGFADQSHFTRTFKAEFGVTPAQYRRDNARLPEGE